MNKVSVRSLNEFFNVSGEDFIEYEEIPEEDLIYRPNIKPVNFGVPNPEHSEFMKNFPRSPESNKKRSETLKGRKRKPRTEDEKKKISESLKGKKYKPRSEEHCKKISENSKGISRGKGRIITWKTGPKPKTK
jgi:hypothetical protein